jgi:hypothetical protein
MTSQYVFAADDSVVEFFSRCSKREREFQVKRFGRWLVTFWADDRVLELRVVDLQKIVP